ncbi:MAG: fused MFS/spermidine synthase [Gemmataceae bacterium]
MRGLFIITVTLGSALLFLVQPMCARFLLPLLGGTPAVWTTCMLFFQAGLLAGYAYAHLLPGRLGLGAHALLHCLLLGAAALLLPFNLTETTPGDWPVPWLLLTLAVAVGAPYMLLAANAPLLQRWFAKSGRDPYFLYAASNIGSFAGLLAYPFLLEPAWGLREQALIWAGGFFALTALTVACTALGAWKHAAAPVGAGSGGVSGLDARAEERGHLGWQRLRWLLLALVPSSLMLSVTSYLTTDIAPLPLFWVIPLGLYLLTFVLAFSRRTLVAQRALVRWSPLAVVIAVLMILREANEPILLVLGLHVAVFAMLALMCHGELARTRPPVQRLTEFYLWLALGGVLGGLVNAVVAPLLFKGLVEYPLILVLAMFLRPRAADLDRARVAPPWETATRLDVVIGLTVGALSLVLVLGGGLFGMEADPLSLVVCFVVPLIATYAFHAYPVRFALALGGIVVAGSWYPTVLGTVVLRERSFFGVHRVAERDGLRCLIHGHILHGCQDPERPREPLTYYSKTGPAGRFLLALKGDDRLRHVGLVGLGTGSLAAYAEKDDAWTFFEIDPTVIRIARDSGWFTFLADAQRRKARIDIVPGDARLALRSFRGDKFGVLVLDAFGSDAIPTHLLTREAFEEYRGRLRDDGYLLIHVSNNYVDLKPVLANLAGDLKAQCRVFDQGKLSASEEASGKKPSVWVVFFWPPAAFPESLLGWDRPAPRPDLGVWTDDRANLLPLLRWTSSEE